MTLSLEETVRYQTELGTSDKTNDIESFWAAVMKLYKPHIYTSKNILENHITTIAKCPNPYAVTSQLYDNSIAISFPIIEFEICEPKNYVCDDLLNFYFIKYATYASTYGKDVPYYILNITINCSSHSIAHRIIAIISNNEKIIAIMEPNTTLYCTPENSHRYPLIFKNLLSIYKKIDKSILQLNNGDTYTVTCPCYRKNGIQSILSNPQRSLGTCSIVSLLIAHIAIYTQNISKDILKKLMCLILSKNETERFEFTDAYLQYLFRKAVYINRTELDKEIQMKFNVISMTRGLLEHLKYTHQLDKEALEDFYRKTTVNDFIRSVSKYTLFPRSNVKATSETFRFQDHFFKSFIDDDGITKWVFEEDYKIKLKYISAEEVFIDTYYANEKGGPNLDVLREMLKDIPNVIINNETKVRTDDYRDIPYGLWPLVKYSSHQFYRQESSSGKATFHTFGEITIKKLNSTAEPLVNEYYSLYDFMTEST